MSTQINLTWEEWAENYKPIKNHVTEHSDEFLFETYGEELAFILRNKDNNPYRIWTLISEGTSSWIEEGFHFVNRLGYYFTEIEFNPDNQYIVDESNWGS